MSACRFCGQDNPPGTRFCTNPACRMYQWDANGEPPPTAEPARPSPMAEPSADPDADVRPAIRMIAGARRQAPPPPPEGGTPPPAAEPREPPRPRTATKTRAGRVAVALSLGASELAVDPGNVVATEMLVKNTGTLVDQFALTVEGPAGAWAAVDPPALNLYPDQDAATAILSFTPPRAYETPAGPAMFVVRATSREDPDVHETAAGVLVVGPYLEVDTMLVPQTSRGKRGAEHQINVRNRGNAPIQAALAARDPDDELAFGLDPTLVSIPPGEVAVSRVSVSPRKRLWMGAPRLRSFVVDGDVGHGTAIRADGRHEQQAVIPAWVVKWAPIILIPLIGLLVYLLTTARIPAVTGLAQQEADELLTGAGFDPSYQFVQSTEVGPGLVVSTEPPRGGRERKGTEVAVAVSAGPNPAQVPPLRRLDANVARAQLLSAGLDARIQREENSRVAPGQVFASEPAPGSIVPPGYQVLLRVAPGGSDPDNRGIVDFGPVDRSTGFPSWYQDSRREAMRLEPCLDAASLCSTSKEAFVGTPPDGTAYYYRAQSAPITSPLNNGQISFETAVVAAFGATGEAPCDPGACAERTYSLIRIAADAGTLTPGEDYVFTHPYGTTTITANPSGGITPEHGREEVGCLPDPPQECRWEVVQEGRVGPFLVWDADAPAGFIGDGATPHKVTGSPLDTNLVRVEGPGFGDGVGTDQFVVMGKLSAASTPPPGQSGVRPDPPTLTVPAQRAGVTSPPQVLTLTNHGDSNLSIGELQIAGVNNNDWALTAQNCTGRTIPGGGSCQVRISVQPATGGPTNGELTVLSNAFGAPHKIPLSGAGQAPTAEAEPAQLDLGSSPAGTAAPPKAVVVSNKGDAPLRVATVEVTGPATRDFQIAANQCTAPVPPGSSCSIRVGFTPTTGGQRSATLSLTTDAPVGGTVTGVSLSGTGQAASAQISPESVEIPAYGKATVTLTSKGTAPLRVTAVALEGPNAASFQIAGSCAAGATLAPQGSCQAEVSFPFVDLGAVVSCPRATLTIRTDDPGAPAHQADITGRTGLLC